MDTLYLVDPALRSGLEMFTASDLNVETLPQSRAFMLDMAEAGRVPLPDGIERSVRQITGGDGQPLDVIIYRPTASTGGALLHMHGGGYVAGSAAMSEANNITLVQAIGCVLVSVDYRLAPETAFPGALYDCHAALRWLHDEASTLGIDPSRIAVRGESAGGGLAAALALYARDNNGPPICHQCLIYPMLDDRTGSTVEPNRHAGEFVWTAASNRFGWGALLGRPPGGRDVPAHAAPARADDLTGLPPTFLATAALDLFIDENMLYAQRLLRAGVPTELHVYPGAYHGFDMVADAPATRAMRRDATAALKAALSSQG